MCQKDTWYVFTDGQCFNPVAHAVLCAVLIPVSMLLIVKGFLVRPNIVPRAQKILGLYMLTQAYSIVLETFGLIFLKTDSNSLRLFRFFLFATFANILYWGIMSRTIFFLETVASTQQYNPRQWSYIKLCLAVSLGIYTVSAYTLLIILPGTLPKTSQQELCIRIAVGIAAVFHCYAMVLCGLVGYRLLAVIRTVVTLGLAQPARMATAKENLVILREGLMKSSIAYTMTIVVTTTAAVFGLYWVIMHILVIASQVAFAGTISYLQTCKAPTDPTPKPRKFVERRSLNPQRGGEGESKPAIRSEQDASAESTHVSQQQQQRAHTDDTQNSNGDGDGDGGGEVKTISSGREQPFVPLEIAVSVDIGAMR